MTSPRRPVRIGAKLPHTGPTVGPASVPRLARELETAGFDSLWVSDHVVQPEVISSPYPFAADGKATWPTDTPYLEAVVSLTAAAAVTDRVRLGTAALVLPQRNPVLLAKQVASLDVLSGGRAVLGVGAGWLREEFDALAAPFDGRGARMTEWIALLRECWTGRTAGHHTGNYDLAPGILALPAPANPVPILVGGHSPVALRRAGRLGDGWLAQQAVPTLDPAHLATEIAAVRQAAAAAGRDPAALTVVLRLVESAGHLDTVARRLADLHAAGVDEIIVDTSAGRPDADLKAEHDLLRDAGSSF